MRSGRSRREFIRIGVTALSGGLAGCSTLSSGGGPVSVTPAPVPSTATEQTDPTPGRLAELSDRFDFQVKVLNGFEQASPARLEVTVWNRNEIALTALAGSRLVLPFEDPDYAGIDQSGDPGLSLVPDETRVRVDRDEGDPKPLTALLPAEPIDGCWRLPFAWSQAALTRDPTLQTVKLVPGERRIHQYRLYFIGQCEPDTYRFENRFDLAVGGANGDRELFLARLGFDVTVTADRAVRVSVQPPDFTFPPRGLGRK